MMEEQLSGDSPVFQDGKFYSEGIEISREEAESLGWSDPAIEQALDLSLHGEAGVSKVPGDEGIPITNENRFDHEGIHTYFGLSYANYLVVNRSLLQSMPDEWQKKFCLLLEEFSEEFGWAMQLQPAINVQILKREPEMIEDRVDCETCGGEGTDPDDEDEPCPECDGECSFEGEERYETPEEVGIMTDPVAHYERGRASVPRASMSIEEVGDWRYWRMYGEWLKANHIEEWRKQLGPEFEDGEEVEVVHNPAHVRPPILGDSPGLLDGKIVEAIDHCLYWVDVEVGNETFKVQLHADQLRSCKRR